jgi:hypothetical protein
VTERTLSCARLSRADVEPMHATAANAPRWILLEEPGPGGCDAVLEQRLPPTTAARLKTVAHGMGARVLLIRRHGRYTPVGRRCYAVSSKPGGSWVEYFSLERAEDVLDIDWSPLGQNQSVGGRELPHPLYVVCTNGRHDPCCAEFGRPVADSLQEDYGERVWESAHLGGDRFAGNMVLLPEGHYYGRLDVHSAPSVVARYERGLLDLDHYRGRSCYPPPVQAAEHFARRGLGLDGVDDLVLRSVTRDPPDQVRVGFGIPVGGIVVVTVQRVVRAVDRRLTCRDGAQGGLVRHELVDLVTHPG